MYMFTLILESPSSQPKTRFGVGKVKPKEWVFLDLTALKSTKRRVDGGVVPSLLNCVKGYSIHLPYPPLFILALLMEEMYQLTYNLLLY